MLHERDGDFVVPRYLQLDDECWLESLIELLRRMPGLPRRDFVARLRDVAPRRVTLEALSLASHVALQLCRDPPRSSPSPPRARWEVYRERGRCSSSRDEVLSIVAARLGTTPGVLEQSLISDLPSQRRVGLIPGDLSATQLSRLINLRLAQGLVARAEQLTIDLEGHVRRVVQQATWQGLLCTVRERDAARCRIEFSGPMALLRTTRIYGRALASLVPILPWCRRFRLEAAGCMLKGKASRFHLDESAPIACGKEPRRHDSSVEKAFEADIRRLAPDWDVLREPQALAAAGTLVFPDFAIGPAAAPSSRVLVEIAGWWTSAYLETKLARLRAAGCEGLIVCVEERVEIKAGATAGLDVLPFRRRVDAGRVLVRAREILALHGRGGGVSRG